MSDRIYKAFFCHLGLGSWGHGVWLVKLDAQDAGGPYTIKATSKVDTRTLEILLEDVLFGDVWICSGQSNMQFTVHQVRYRTIIPRARMSYSLMGHALVKSN